MVKFTGHTSFLQKNPMKPVPVGIKLYVLMDSETGYVLDIIIDCFENFNNHEMVTVDVTLQLLARSGYLDRNFLVVGDNWYTSPTLLLELRKRDTFLLGTLHTVLKMGLIYHLILFLGTVRNVTGIPQELTFRKGELANALKRGEFIMVHNGNLLFHSFSFSML